MSIKNHSGFKPGRRSATSVRNKATVKTTPHFTKYQEKMGTQPCESSNGTMSGSK